MYKGDPYSDIIVAGDILSGDLDRVQYTQSFNRSIFTWKEDEIAMSF